MVRRDSGTIEHHFFRDLPKFLDSSYLIIANNSKVVNCKLLPVYYDNLSSAKVKKTLVVYLLKQLTPDRWLVSGDDELESKGLGFQVFIHLDAENNSDENGGSRTMIGTLVQIDSDGSLEMVFRYSGDSNSDSSSSSSSSNSSSSRSKYRCSSSNLKRDLQSAASIPLPPYIEPENAIKVSITRNAVVSSLLYI